MRERLQKILSRAGIASRRRAELLITTGHVKVNGQIVRELGLKADPDQDRIVVDNRPVILAPTIVYALHKPLDVVSTNRDPERRTTVLDLVPVSPRVYPIGRLDRMTAGLILLTNDGELALHLSHPRYEHSKEYELIGTSLRPLTELLSRMRRGVRLQDGWFVPDDVQYVGQRKDQLVFRVVVHEGRNHLLRRFSARVGLELTRLTRIRVGPITLTGLSPGMWRRLGAEELRMLRQLVTEPVPGLPDRRANATGDRLPSRSKVRLEGLQPRPKRGIRRPAK